MVRHSQLEVAHSARFQAAWLTLWCCVAALLRDILLLHLLLTPASHLVASLVAHSCPPGLPRLLHPLLFRFGHRGNHPLLMLFLHPAPPGLPRLLHPRLRPPPSQDLPQPLCGALPRAAGHLLHRVRAHGALPLLDMCKMAQSCCHRSAGCCTAVLRLAWAAGACLRSQHATLPPTCSAGVCKRSWSCHSCV